VDLAAAACRRQWLVPSSIRDGQVSDCQIVSSPCIFPHPGEVLSPTSKSAASPPRGHRPLGELSGADGVQDGVGQHRTAAALDWIGKFSNWLNAVRLSQKYIQPSIAWQ
jgi:hypothetical protein